MAVAELQISQTALSSLIQHLVSAQRLPSATIKIPFFPVLDDKPLDSIACVGCTFSTANFPTIFAELDLQFRYYTGLAAVKAAGSLNQPATETANHPLRLELSVELVGPKATAALVAKDPFKLKGLESLASHTLDIDGIAPFKVVGGAIVLSEDSQVAAIRLASDPGDALNTPVTNKLVPGSDWTLFIPGSAIADVVRQKLASAIDAAVGGDPKYEIGKSASADYIPFPLAGVSNDAPFVLASAEIVAVDACPIFNIDVSVDLQAVATFVPKAHSIETTLKFAWDADSTWCQIADSLVATPIAAVLISKGVGEKADDAIFGSGLSPDGFKEIGRGDSSITYRQEKVLGVPSPLIANAVVFNAEGSMVSGGLIFAAPGQGLQGWVTPASSGISIDCKVRRAVVAFHPPQVGVVDHSPPGSAPRVFPETLVLPANAWIVIPGTGNDTLETLITFGTPPTGRLPVGTPTSVFLSTDCGMRWVDLGVVPPDHAAPTPAETAVAISQCLAKSASWKERVLSVFWLPRPPDDGRIAFRQWVVGLVDIAAQTQLQFYAITERGGERLIGTATGTTNLPAQITTARNETLQIRSSSAENPAPQVFGQRWIYPIASTRLSESPKAIAAFGGLIGLRGQKGETEFFEVGSQGELGKLPIERVPIENGREVIKQLDRAQRYEQHWLVMAQLDSRTIAVVHENDLLVCTTEELQNVLTDTGEVTGVKGFPRWIWLLLLILVALLFAIYILFFSHKAP